MTAIYSKYAYLLFISPCKRLQRDLKAFDNHLLSTCILLQQDLVYLFNLPLKVEKQRIVLLLGFDENVYDDVIYANIPIALS